MLQMHWLHTSYSGKSIEKSSMSLRAFFFPVTKATQFSNFHDESTLALAVFHLDGRAATWYIRQEEANRNPITMEELRRAKFRKFIPSIEKLEA